MAFDVYAGSFTRFYTRNWETVAQRQARLTFEEAAKAGRDSFHALAEKAVDYHLPLVLSF